MRKWYKPRLTKKQYKRSLAGLGVAALWLTAVWAMTLPSSQASAGKGFTSHAWGYSDAAASRGTGGAYPTTKGEELLQEAALAATKKFQDLCVGFLPGCGGHPAEAENADFHGSGISFSTGGVHADGGEGYRQTAGNDFSAGYGYGGGAFGGAFGGLAPGGMGYGGFRAAVTADAVPDGVVTLESVEDPDSNNPLRFIKEDIKGPTEGPTTDEPPPTFIAGLPPDGPGSPKDTPTPDGPITTLAVAVPEPFTLSLFAMGLMGAAGVRARKSRKARAAA